MRDYVLFGDCRDSLKIIANEEEKARMCVTSPPYYGLRDYGGEENQIGQEQSPEHLFKVRKLKNNFYMNQILS